MKTATSHSASSAQRIPNRRGWTMVETLIVATLASLLLGLVATFMQGILQINGTLQRDLLLQNAIDRLDRQFRHDARAAIEYSTNTAPPGNASPEDQTNIESETLRLRMGNQRQIVYRSLPGRVHREVIQDGERTDVEAFHLPPDVRVTWRPDARQVRTLLHMLIDDPQETGSLEDGDPPRQTVMAHVHADQRFRGQGPQ